MMSFLALNSQVAEASETMDEIPITTAAKEMAFRQAMAFPFLEDECIGRPRPSCRVCTSACANPGTIRRSAVAGALISGEPEIRRAAMALPRGGGHAAIE